MTALRILVVGGGIGGCAAAVALTRAGHHVDVFERAAAYGELGAGIQISPNASLLLQRYGLGAELNAIAVRPEGMVARRWDNGQVLTEEPLGKAVEDAFGAPHIHVHRADLLAVIGGAIPAGHLHFGRTCVAIEESGRGVRALFEDGTSAEGDVLVGADGIRSAVRRHLHGEEAPLFSGNIAFRGLAPADRLLSLGLTRTVTNWMGPGGHFVHYFVSAGRFLNFVAVSEQSQWRGESWNDAADPGEIRERFAGWHPTIHEILGAVDIPFKWGLFDRPPLPQWSRRRVTLLGDACHPMLPYMAQGAAQAIEDGATLARCLSVPPHEVPDALLRYESLRKARTSDIQSRSARNARVFHLRDGPEQEDRDARMAARQARRSADPVGRSGIFGHDAEAIEPATPA